MPLTGQGIPALLSELHRVAALPADLYEWRIDCFFGDPLPVLPAVVERLGGKHLCTLRTQQEGGQASLSPERCSPWLILRGGTVGRLVRLAKNKVAVVLSKHDFEKTPSAREITATLLRMKDLGADLPKYAVMPQTPGDVLELLSATWQASSQAGPVITMAMGELGKVTRAAGGVFGCAMTFGAGESASAPGQIDAENLRAILEDLNLYNSAPPCA